MGWESSDANVFFVSILLKNMGWYVGVMGNIHNDECLVYIFTGKVQNVTPSMFNKNTVSLLV